MHINKLKDNEFLEYKKVIQKLLKYSYMTNFDMSEEACSNTAKEKIDKLGEYISVEKAIVYGAIEKNSLVGFIWLHIHDYFGESRLHINQLVIEKDYRGRGIAKRLLAETEKFAMESKINTVDLFVSEDNLAAVNIYINSGYVTERRYLKKIFKEAPDARSTHYK